MLSGRVTLQNSSTEIQTLINLGLNNLQAKVYLCLAKSGTSSVAAIAKQSKTSTSETQNVMINLFELGIVQKVSEKPQLYKAASADQTLKFLMQRKTKQSNELKFDTGSLVSNLIIRRDQFKEQNRLVSISQKEVFLNRGMEAIHQVEVSIDFILTWDMFLECAQHVNQKTNKPNIMCRFIVEQPSNIGDLEILKKFNRWVGNIRFMQASPKALLGIYDKKDLMIIDGPDSDMNSSSSMWTSTKSIVTLSQSYFENLWLKSSKEPIQKNPV